jgi:hypothetical protein
MITGEPTMYKHMSKILMTGLLVALTVPAAAQDEEPTYDAYTENCVDLRRVRSTDVVDDKNIFFRMSGDVVYHNILPRACHGLARENRFSYKTSISRLCRLDTIAVLYNDVRGLREGNRCGLGLFHKITKEDADAFKEGLKQGPEANPLPMPEPEEVDDTNQESEDPESA